MIWFKFLWLDMVEFWWWLRRRPMPRDIWHEVKWAIQRMRRGWSDRDNWSMYSYVGPMMADMLKQLRENGISYYCVHPGKFNEHALAGEGVCGSDDWHEMLQRVEFGLRYYAYVHDDEALNDYGFDEWQRMLEVAEEVRRQAFRDLGEYWGALWD